MQWFEAMVSKFIFQLSYHLLIKRFLMRFYAPWTIKNNKIILVTLSSRKSSLKTHS